VNKKSLLAAMLALPAVGVGADPLPSNALSVVVRETAGIRRGNFPALGQAQLARGALHDVSNLRLLLSDKEVPVQATAVSRWPDGSIRQVEINFNASIGPLGELRYRLEIGGTVRAQPVVNERLEVIESTDGLQVGKLRFARQPAALLQSVAFGREIAGDGMNAISVTDAGGATYLLDGDVAIEIVKPGPLAVQIRYGGALRLPGDYVVPFTITIDVPNTKSWVRYAARVEDPRREVREIALDASFRFGGFPWTWDFGTGSWSYGAFRNTTDSAVLTQVVGPEGAGDWQIATGPHGHEQLYARAAGERPARAEGWGHLQGVDRAVAFAIEGFGRAEGQYVMALDGSGQIAFRFAPAQPADVHVLAVYQHYVATPVPVGAATNPVAMTSPLLVTVEP